ncbi:hypothetical protein LJR044_002511 [Microbacterium foliorum]
MTVANKVPSPFDLTLPYFIPNPVLGTNDLILRFVSESLPARSLGPISEWPSYGGPNRRLYMTTSANYPTLMQEGERRIVRFDGVDDLMTVDSPPTMTTCTVYLVAKFSTVDAARHVLLNMGGANIGIDGSKIRVSGSSSTMLSTLNVNAAEWIVIAVTFNGNDVTLTYKTETVSATITVGALSLFTLGGTGGLWFGGGVFEANAFDSVHNASTRTSYMNQLREWYNAA